MDPWAIVGFLADALRAIDSVVLSVALVLLASIFAAIGGLLSWRLRLYGAMTGGMVVNVVAKAEGAGYEAAFAAMLVATAIAAALGGTGMLVRLMNAAKAAKAAKAARRT